MVILISGTAFILIFCFRGEPNGAAFLDAFIGASFLVSRPVLVMSGMSFDE
jgi:hypothetical protein